MSSHSGKDWLIQGKPKDNSVGPWNHISPLQWAEGLGFETSALGNFLAEHLAHICVKKSKTDKKQDMDLFHGKSAIRTGSPTF